MKDPSKATEWNEYYSHSSVMKRRAFKNVKARQKKVASMSTEYAVMYLKRAKRQALNRAKKLSFNSSLSVDDVEYLFPDVTTALGIKEFCARKFDDVLS